MKNPFSELKDWIREILEAVKKDLKSDHLPADPVFYKTYFGNRPQNRLAVEEVFSAYERELLSGNEDLAVFVTNRWVFKNGDLYQHFENRLRAICPEFDQIKELTEEESQKVLDGAEEAFGAIGVYLFSVLNGVVFPKNVIEGLKKRAQGARETAEKEGNLAAEQNSLEKILALHKREVARLHDKIAGVQKKYTNDVEALKKQVKALQKQLASK